MVEKWGRRSGTVEEGRGRGGRLGWGGEEGKGDGDRKGVERRWG